MDMVYDILNNRRNPFLSEPFLEGPSYQKGIWIIIHNLRRGYLVATQARVGKAAWGKKRFISSF